jgi:capsular polysaccharide transport system permease protein
MIDLNSLTSLRLKLALIALPMAIAILYLSVFASNRYVSTSTVALQQASEVAASLPGAALLAGLSSPSREETLYLKQYVHSQGLLQHLDAKLKLREHYSTWRLDLPLRLPGSARQEDFFDYYRSRVEINMDELSSTLTLRVQGFDPEFAQRLNQAILDESERFVNEVSHKLAREKLGFAEGELRRASDKLQEAKAEVLAFQTKNKLLDPMVQARASGMMVAELQAEITKGEAELRALRSYLNEDSFQIKALRSQIDATRAQMDAERSRSTGDGQRSDRVGALAIEFEGLKTKAEFAVDAYRLALTAVENGRIDATRKLKSLIVIEPPTHPETAEYPRRLYNLTTLLIACLLLYGIVRLVLATIREHQD